MISRIYIEDDVRDLLKTQQILKKFPKAEKIYCDYYGEVFNPKSQNFRLQKQNPALILAKKRGNLVLKTPEGFGIGGSQNYYFSHMLNCIYDCRYCYLQGMYDSANYVMFVNFDDFKEEIKNLAKEPAYFFSGYDCDSLAFEKITDFTKDFLPFFHENKNAILELRTKSTAINELTKQEVFNNCVIAYSFTPEEISKEIEHKVPRLKHRLKAIKRLSEYGWQVGIRLDPLIYCDNFKDIYGKLIRNIFANLKISNIHSVSIGPMRFPVKMLDKITKLYPGEKLFAYGLEKRGQVYSYRSELEQGMENFVRSELSKYISDKIIFKCNVL